MGVKGKKNTLKVFFVVLFLIFSAICAYPYLGLSEGSFLNATLGELHSLLVRFAGFFSAPDMQVFTLLPLLGFLFLSMLQILCGISFIYIFFELVAFCGFYIIAAFIQGGGPYFETLKFLPSDNWHYIGVVAVFVSLVCSLFLMIKEMGTVRKNKVRKMTQPDSDDEEESLNTGNDESEQSSDVQRKAVHHNEDGSDLTEDMAIALLNRVTVPDYKIFPTVTESSVPDFFNEDIEFSSSMIKPKISAGTTVQNVGKSSIDMSIFKVANNEGELHRNAIKNKAASLQNVSLDSSDYNFSSLKEKLKEDMRVMEAFSSVKSDLDYDLSELPSALQLQETTERSRDSASYPQETARQGQNSESQFSRSAQAEPQLSRQMQAEPILQTLQFRQSTEDFVSGASSGSDFQASSLREISKTPDKGNLEIPSETAKEIFGTVKESDGEPFGASGVPEKESFGAPKTQDRESFVSFEEPSEKVPEKFPEKTAPEFPESSPVNMNQNIDTSAVGGLKSSRDGSYVYDSSKFTYRFPPESYLKHYESVFGGEVDVNTDVNGHTIVDTLSQFKIETQLVGIQRGPTFTLYELALARGVKVNNVQNYANNIAMDLAVPSVRILAPIPGKSAVGIEVPNRERETIGFDIMLNAIKSPKLKVPMALGKTITGECIAIDLASTPHLLIAGTTGSGKSVCVNGLICSILYTRTPRQVRMIMVDPKMVELSVYNDIPHLLTPVITEPKRAIKAMAFVIEEMERRMKLFSLIGAKKIDDYNRKIKEGEYLREELPYIVVIIDEFADLMMATGKELENYINRITAVARFTGIHLVLATQRPSSDVITGVIKNNIPTQIAFAVTNQINSRIILDTSGAESLLGRGDMLYASAANRTPIRIQGAYIDSEIENIVKFVKTQGKPDYIDEAFFDDDDEGSGATEENNSSGSEDLYMKAWRLVAEKGEASASYLQRRLQIGYNKAANLIEQLEENGCVGPARGSKPREILRFPDSRSETGN